MSKLSFNFGLISFIGGILIVIFGIGSLLIESLQEFDFLFLLLIPITLVTSILSFYFERNDKDRIKMAIAGLSIIIILFLLLFVVGRQKGISIFSTTF